jgi:TPP-dependent pyruvate/acetoin dehydrogenase alpha subunit
MLEPSTNHPLYQPLFRQALLIRAVEERIIALYPSDKIQSPVHLSIGQEAVAVGVCHGLRKQDPLFGTYRSHAFYLAKGGDLKQMLAELYGKVTGCGRGKAGSMHLAAPEVGYMGSSAVVASTIPHAVGAAWAAKLRGLDQVVVAVFGDGATDEGVYHESLNFAALHQVPVLLVCENNGLAVHAAIKDRQAFSIVEHAATYGLPAERIEEGYDFVEVALRLDEHIARVRADRRPRLVEIRTYRYQEHVGPGDDFQAGYRSRGELDAWQRKDPLCWDTATRAQLLPGVRAEIDEAVAFAEQSPWPGPEELLADVI